MNHSKKDREKIAECAYFKWLGDGAPQNNNGEKYWHEAEQELTKSDVIFEEIDLESSVVFLESIEVDLEENCVKLS